MNKAGVRLTKAKLGDAIARMIEDHGLTRPGSEPDHRRIKQILNFGGGSISVTLTEPNGAENTFAIRVVHQTPA